ncbi:MAG: PLDc N-terminal domain-containing protein, partial [bacterium]
MAKHILVSLFAIGIFCQFAFAEVDSSTKLDINKQVQALVSAVNEQKVENVDQFLAQEMSPAAKEEIRSTLAGQKITWSQELSEFEELPDGHIKVSGYFSVKSINSSKSGPGIYFILKHEGNDWKITETNFHKFELKLPPWFFAIIAVSLVLFAFWIWMVIDCIKRTFPDSQKVTWLLFLFFFSIFAATFYFFKVKRR